MALARIPVKLPINLLPGSFTGNYTPKAQLAVLENAAVAFSGELEKTSKKLKYGVNTRLQNVPNCHPLTSTLAEEVGHYGLRWGRLDLLQYYKKNSPPPAFF